MLTYVGLDPHKDVNWVVGPTSTDPKSLFAQGRVDAFMGFAPHPQELRRMKIGHVILDTAQDRPWSQYFCCMAIAQRDFVRSHPVATKRILRAYLKAADVCAQDPEGTARLLVDKEWERRYDIGLEVLKKLPWKHWRSANPEDTLRFYALRLHEAKVIKTAPHRLVAQNTDWRFLNELKRELKA
jgi:NitT/TauT family transport system substrate-binding protein